MHYDNCNVVLDWDGEGNAIYDLMENWIVKFATSFPVKYMELFAFHNVTGSPLGAIIGELSKAIGNELTHGGIVPKANVNRALENISMVINSRIADYGERFNNIAEYNAAAPDNAQSAIFCVICDYPNGFSVENQKEILGIMKEGNRCGVYTVLIRNRLLPAPGSEYGKKEEILDSLQSTLTIKAVNNKFYLNGYEYTFNLGGNATQVTELLDSLKESKNQKSMPIPLRSLQLPKRRMGNDFSENLLVPVGKVGSQVQHIEMSPNDQTVHLLVAGMTGSGKSVFLHTFILSAANTYSPSELEFYLIDLKDGVEFNLYRDVLRIPHIKMLAVNEGDMQATYEMLKALSEEMTRRNAIFKRLNTRNIVDYNERVLSNDYDKQEFGALKPISRAVIVIDEYQEIFGSSGKYGSMCVEELKSMAKKARSSGMGLLLSSQTVPTSGFGEIKEQIDNIVLFNAKEETIDKLLPGKSRYRNDLSREKGNAFYSCRGAEPILFRAAYPGDRTDSSENGLYANAKRINTKYSDAVSDIIIAGENFELPVMQSRLGFITGSDIPLPRSNDSVALVYGQSGRTGYQQTIRFESSAAVLPIFGDAVQSKHLEMTLLLSAIHERKLNDLQDEIYYLDCNPVRKQNMITAVSACKKFHYYSGVDECTQIIKDLQKVVASRANDGFNNNLFIFIHRAAALCEGQEESGVPMISSDKLKKHLSGGQFGHFDSEAIIALKALIKDAGHAGVNITIQVDNDKEFAKVFGKDNSFRHLLFVSGADAKSALDAYINIPLSNEDKNAISTDDICIIYTSGETFTKARKIVYDEASIEQIIEKINGDML